MTETTLDFHGAKLIVPTDQLVDAWVRRHSPVLVPPHFERPTLLKDEAYVGAYALGEDKLLHTILLPDDRADAPWDAQMAWAKGEGFDLPNRLELLMMWSTMRNRFQEAAYWSNEAHHDDSSYAWFQYFDGGYQYDTPKSAALRAVAVRRSPIQSFTHS